MKIKKKHSPECMKPTCFEMLQKCAIIPNSIVPDSESNWRKKYCHRFHDEIVKCYDEFFKYKYCMKD